MTTKLSGSRRQFRQSGSWIAFILLMLIPQLLFSATKVIDLRVDYQKNPIGIDTRYPKFSWRMEAEQRGTQQTAYQIKLFTDAGKENNIWDSGLVENDKSVHIEYTGDELLPATRYYWSVTVRDQQNNEVTSAEDAWFETSVKDWAGAQWIKATTIPQGEEKEEEPNYDNIINYSITMDFEIVDLAAGICFGKVDDGNFFMWQINLEEAKPRLRPHTWVNGGGACIEQKELAIEILKNKVYNFRLDITGDLAKTYVNGTLIDERVNPLGGNYGYGEVGFRAQHAGDVFEKAWFDNIKVESQEGDILFSADFENGNSYNNGTVENGRLLVTGGLLEVRYWPSKTVRNSGKYTIEMDVTLISSNAGIIFSASNTDNMYMWSINTKDQSYPILRRHFYVQGGISSSDHRIEGFAKEDLLNKEVPVKIEVENNIIRTYINNSLIDTYEDNSGKLFDGYVGFRAHSDGKEHAYYDNIKVTSYKDGEAIITFSEDFEGDTHSYEGTPTIVVNGNTKLNVYSNALETRILPDVSKKVPLFRHTFMADKEIRKAKVYASALGVFDLFINGERVGRIMEDGSVVYDELKPGWTDYEKTVNYFYYDVTPLLKTGKNAIGANVSTGWWAGAVSHGKYENPVLGFIARLEIEYTDGSKENIVTNTDWLSTTTGAWWMGDIYDGEKYDAQDESDWTLPEYDDSHWFQTAINTSFKGEIKPLIGPSVQIRPELEQTPISVTIYQGATPTGTTHGTINQLRSSGNGAIQLKKGETAVYDLGQNMVGWIRFTAKGNSGTCLKFRFAEMLNYNGDEFRGDDGPGGSIYTASLRSAKASLYYTMKGDEEGETFSPTTTFYGFRYCEVTATQDVEILSLVGEVVGSVTEEGSSLVTSDASVNQLYSNVMWGQRGNFLSVPTDCPQRDERLGWTGDAQVFVRAASYNADVAAFFHKWMQDMRDSQRSDGAYPDVAPHSWVGHGNGAWAEAGIIVPWTIWQMYADKSIIEENYESMNKYMNFLANQARDGYLYNGAGDAYGDWLSYEHTDRRFVSVLYYAYAAQLMAKMSAVLDTPEAQSNVEKYNKLYEEIKKEFQGRYIQSDGTLRESTQTAYLWALKLDLFASEQHKNAAIEILNNKIRNNGNKLSTGFVGTGILNQTLSTFGLTNTAYNLLLQRDNPSWLYSVDQGATTIWERWDSYTIEKGFNIVDMNSFNHYSYGAVSEWMYRFMAGIELDEKQPGFKHILLQPHPDDRTQIPSGQERITSVDATYKSYYGNIRSAWQLKSDKTISYTAEVPANTTATLYLPISSTGDIIYEGNKPAAEAEGVTYERIEDGKAIFTLQSGKYTFEIEKDPSGVTEENFRKISIYPIPVDDILHIDSENKVVDVKLVDQSGRVIYSQAHNEPINMSGMSGGIYLLKILTDKNTETIKLMKN